MFCLLCGAATDCVREVKTGAIWEVPEMVLQPVCAGHGGKPRSDVEVTPDA